MKKRFSAIFALHGMLRLSSMTANAEESQPIEQTYQDFTYVNYGDSIEITGFDGILVTFLAKICFPNSRNPQRNWRFACTFYWRKGFPP